MKRYLIGLLLCLPLVLAAQSTAPDGAAAPAPLPTEFRGIRLGMDLAAVKSQLQQDPLFDYRGDPDVSLLPSSAQSLIECSGSSYIRRAYFQFYENTLYIMILSLNQRSLDYFTLYTTLSDKYGDPPLLSPSDAVWKSEEIRLSLERPLSVKYIDRRVFDSLQDQGRAQDNLRDLSREKFLEAF